MSQLTIRTLSIECQLHVDHYVDQVSIECQPITDEEANQVLIMGL